MDSVIRKGLGVALVLAVVCAALANPALAGKGKANVHKPPYKKGHSGGDSWNYVHADAKAGEVAVVRTFPGISPIVGCAPEPDAGWATLTETHHVTSRVDTVTIDFDAVLDPYAWVYAVVYDHRGDSLGLEKYQGPHAGAGKLKVKLFRKPKMHSAITVEFGVQVGDSCPQVSEGLASFPSIKID